MNRVLLIGATGHPGQYFVPALREKSKDVVVLLRPETAKTTDAAKRALLDGFSKAGATIAEGSMDDNASLKKACAGIDVVIGCVNGGQLSQQPALVAAARKAGVKRFFASEWGVDSNLAEKGQVALLDWKRDLAGVFNSSGVRTTYAYDNGFATYWGASLGQLSPDGVLTANATSSKFQRFSDAAVVCCCFFRLSHSAGFAV